MTGRPPPKYSKSFVGIASSMICRRAEREAARHGPVRAGTQPERAGNTPGNRRGQIPASIALALQPLRSRRCRQGPGARAGQAHVEFIASTSSSMQRSREILPKYTACARTVRERRAAALRQFFDTRIVTHDNGAAVWKAPRNRRRRRYDRAIPAVQCLQGYRRHNRDGAPKRSGNPWLVDDILRNVFMHVKDDSSPSSPQEQSDPHQFGIVKMVDLSAFVHRCAVARSRSCGSSAQNGSAEGARRRSARPREEQAPHRQRSGRRHIPLERVRNIRDTQCGCPTGRGPMSDGRLLAFLWTAFFPHKQSSQILPRGATGERPNARGQVGPSHSRRPSCYSIPA